MRDAFTIATWCCRSWRVFDRSNPFRVAGEACTKARPSAGGAGLEPATYGSKDRRAAKLHHPPKCRFTRPPTRWTPPAGPDVTGTARHRDHPQRLLCHDRVDAAGTRHMGPVPVVPLTPDGWRTFLCLRRDSNPRPSAPEADALSTGPRRLVSSAVPTAVHGPDTRRAWNRTTNRDRHHNPFAAPHPIRAGAAPPHRPLSYQYLCFSNLRSAL